MICLDREDVIEAGNRPVRSINALTAEMHRFLSAQTGEILPMGILLKALDAAHVHFGQGDGFRIKRRELKGVSLHRYHPPVFHLQWVAAIPPQAQLENSSK